MHYLQTGDVVKQFSTFISQGGEDCDGELLRGDCDWASTWNVITKCGFKRFLTQCVKGDCFKFARWNREISLSLAVLDAFLISSVL